MRVIVDYIRTLSVDGSVYALRLECRMVHPKHGEVKFAHNEIDMNLVDQYLAAPNDNARRGILIGIVTSAANRSKLAWDRRPVRDPEAVPFVADEGVEFDVV